MWGVSGCGACVEGGREGEGDDGSYTSHRKVDQEDQLRLSMEQKWSRQDTLNHSTIGCRKRKPHFQDFDKRLDGFNDFGL